jgi:phage tail-like protein
MPNNNAPDAEPLGADDITTADRFLLEVEGVEIGVFREVSGLQVTVDVQEVQEGGQNSYVHKLPARMSWPNIVFKRGLTKSDALFDWLQESSGEGFAGNNNSLSRSTGAVTVLNYLGDRLRSFDLIDVFPVRWKGPDFSVGNSNPLEEELEIAHHGFRSKTTGS